MKTRVLYKQQYNRPSKEKGEKERAKKKEKKEREVESKEEEKRTPAKKHQRIYKLWPPRPNLGLIKKEERSDLERKND